MISEICGTTPEASTFRWNTSAYPASEANQVVIDYFQLPASQQQDVLEFLRSL